MKGKILFCLLFLFLLVGVVSANTLILNPVYDSRSYRNNQNEAWAAIRNGSGIGAGQSVDPITLLTSTATTNQYAQINRVSYTFAVNDTIHSYDTIDSAKLSLFTVFKQDTGSWGMSFRLNTANPIDPLASAAGDYDYTRWGDVAIANNIAYASIAVNTWNNFTLTDLTVINKTGYTILGTRSGSDQANSPPTWAASKTWGVTVAGVTNATASKRPILTVEYTPGTPPDTTPPASITNLANDTATCEAINFTWTNPTDDDFNGTEYWWNGTQQFPNFTNAETSKVFTGLTGGVSYTFSTKTFDITGNANASFVNMTAVPMSCGSAPVAAFSANQTNVCIGDYVQFTDESTNTPTGWDWIFDGVNTSTEQNPVFQYNAGGLFDVNMKASNAYGSDWENKTGYINVTYCAPPTPTPTPTPIPTPVPPIGNYSYAFWENESVRINQSLTHDPLQGKATPWPLWILSGYIGLIFLVLALIKPRTYRMDYEINIIISVIAWPFLWYWAWGGLTSVDYIVGAAMADVNGGAVMITQHILYSFPILGWIGIAGNVAGVLITILLISQFKLFKENEENQGSE
ncbi:MAG: PKD domain-containing protein [Methanoregula sp.]|jgi:PKD repeat protein|nr:PKD domain-containing protein [Methanoregula sp.]